MQYDKEAVIAAVKARLAWMDAAEENQFQRTLKAREDQRIQQMALREKITQVMLEHDDIPEDVEGTPYFQALERLFGNIGNLNNGFDTRGPAYFGQAIKAAAVDWSGEPQKDTSQSERLRHALSVFETGAPPTVGVRDLQAFGLMNIVKFGKD